MLLKSRGQHRLRGGGVAVSLAVIVTMIEFSAANEGLAFQSRQQPIEIAVMVFVLESHRLRRIPVRPIGGREGFDLSKDIAGKLD